MLLKRTCWGRAVLCFRSLGLPFPRAPRRSRSGCAPPRSAGRASGGRTGRRRCSTFEPIIIQSSVQEKNGVPTTTPKGLKSQHGEPNAGIPLSYKTPLTTLQGATTGKHAVQARPQLFQAWPAVRSGHLMRARLLRAAALSRATAVFRTGARNRGWGGSPDSRR